MIEKDLHEEDLLETDSSDPDDNQTNGEEG